MLLEGKVALVTGASRGIGAATARLLARHGAAVAVNFHQSGATAAALVSEIEASGGRALAVGADVRERAQVEAMVGQATAALGAVDILVLNAAIQFPMVPFVDYPWEAFEAKLTGELKAAFFCSRAVVPSMIRRGRGSIIAVSSGLSRHPGFGFCAHSTAKSALDAFARALALELGPRGIRVNVVAPGLTLTDATAGLPQQVKEASARQTPLGRNAVAEDVAGAILALVSDEAAFVSGAYVPVSGGSQMM
jgi:3-oxoacyl-[acyl-carrier protein] reductase